MPSFVRSRRFLALWLLGLAALLAMPQAVGGQGVPDPPHLFFGRVLEITVDGQPYDGTLPIELLDADGNLIGQVSIVDDGWSVPAPGSAGEVRFRIGTAVTSPFTVVPGALTSVQLSLTTAIERTVALVAGFNGLAYTGEGPVDPSVIQAGLASPSALVAIFLFDAGLQTWHVWRPAGPAFANSLTEIAQNAPLSLLLSFATTYAGPVAGHAAGFWSLAAGFTAVTFLGQDGTSLADALGLIGLPANVSVVFRFNNGSQTYGVFRPAGPAFANDLLELNRYDVLLVLASAPTIWSYEAFQP